MSEMLASISVSLDCSAECSNDCCGISLCLDLQQWREEVMNFSDDFISVCAGAVFFVVGVFSGAVAGVVKDASRRP
ncbi:hypothetical protein HUF18_00805 [Thalassolituus sp. ST750PaO-4]|uniref:hypothetical protein n=1 Tax=Thalassolituus sp. ST750PaO-4 TaxID=2742965 RepID=UPI001CE32BB5|nr:hypothetical protein [Thalassolituus sp. ST750PaO-4]MCA6058300.1 hypothetical protein [Thalassolituus sp. ST750PaO-4]